MRRHRTPFPSVLPDKWVEKLWGRIQRVETGCWCWLGRTNARGYGMVSYYDPEHYRQTGNRTGVNFLAHRAVYILTNGQIPDDLIVCHHCDNPLCCNPKHLYAGTHQDNANDCTNRGRRRARKGPGAGRPIKFHAGEIVRLRYVEKLKIREICQRLGCQHDTVHRACKAYMAAKMKGCAPPIPEAPPRRRAPRRQVV